jgi:hypothetical protein
VEYPLSIVEVAHFNRINFADFNTLIMPDGWYNLTDTQKKELMNLWIEAEK